MNQTVQLQRWHHWLALLFCLFSAAAGAQPVRLAILPQSEALRNTADLMTAALTAKPEVILLERAQIDRVQREQQLAGFAIRDGLKLGEILAADGVFMLALGKENDKDFL